MENQDFYIDEKALLLLRAMLEMKKGETDPLDKLILQNEKGNVENAFMAVSAHFDDMSIEDKKNLTIALIDFNDAFDEVVNQVAAIQEAYGFEVD